MDALPSPSWYPDPQRDGFLRWWDGARWTEHVQPGRAAGKPVLGQEVTGGVGPATFYRPDEPITHAFPPITDDRYAESPLAAALAEHVRAGRTGGDVQIPAGDHMAVEALHQLRAKGGVLGAVAGVGEQMLVEAVVAKPAGPFATGSDSVAPSAWMAGAGSTATAPGLQSAAGRAGYRTAGRAARGALTVVALWQLLVALVVGTVFLLGGAALAVLVPDARLVALMLVALGALTLGSIAWDLTRRRRPGPW